MGGGEAWKWHRWLLAWEEELVEECKTLLQNVSLQVDNEDYWCWNLDMSIGHSICGVCLFFASQEP